MADDTPHRHSPYCRQLFTRRGVLAGAAGVLATSCAGGLLGRSAAAAPFAADFDLLHSTLAADYCFFGDKATDWTAVQELFRSEAAAARDAEAFMRRVEEVLDTLYDPHTHLGSNRADSWRLPPFDVWAEWHGERAVVAEVRRGSGAQAAGVRAGQEIVAVGGVPTSMATRARRPKALRRADPAAEQWALLSVLAGKHNDQRVLSTRTADGPVVERQLDIHRPETAERERFEWRWLRPGLAYARFSDFSDDGLIGRFDGALEEFRAARALILDLRDNSGGDTAIALPILGRLITERRQYAWMARREGQGLGKRWPEFVDPRGPFTFTGKVVVAVNHWSESMAEGAAMALSGMNRARVVGTRMAGLGAGVHRVRLPASGLEVQYSAEPVYQLDGRPRSDFVPEVMVRLEDAPETDPDPIQTAAIAEAELNG